MNMALFNPLLVLVFMIFFLLVFEGTAVPMVDEKVNDAIGKGIEVTRKTVKDENVNEQTTRDTIKKGVLGQKQGNYTEKYADGSKEREQNNTDGKVKVQGLQDTKDQQENTYLKESSVKQENGNKLKENIKNTNLYEPNIQQLGGNKTKENIKNTNLNEPNIKQETGNISKENIKNTNLYEASIKQENGDKSRDNIKNTNLHEPNIKQENVNKLKQNSKNTNLNELSVKQEFMNKSKENTKITNLNEGSIIRENGSKSKGNIEQVIDLKRYIKQDKGNISMEITKQTNEEKSKQQERNDKAIEASKKERINNTTGNVIKPDESGISDELVMKVSKKLAEENQEKINKEVSRQVNEQVKKMKQKYEERLNMEVKEQLKKMEASYREKVNREIQERLQTEHNKQKKPMVGNPKGMKLFEKIQRYYQSRLVNVKNCEI